MPQNLIKPSSIFAINHGNGKNQTGLLANIINDSILTIEGYSNQTHSREGIGVFKLTR